MVYYTVAYWGHRDVGQGEGVGEGGGVGGMM